MRVVSDEPTTDDASQPEEELSLNAAEFADVYEVDTARAITETKLQRWRDAMEAEQAS